MVLQSQKKLMFKPTVFPMFYNCFHLLSFFPLFRDLAYRCSVVFMLHGFCVELTVPPTRRKSLRHIALLQGSRTSSCSCCSCQLSGCCCMQGVVGFFQGIQCASICMYVFKTNSSLVGGNYRILMDFHGFYMCHLWIFWARCTYLPKGKYQVSSAQMPHSHHARIHNACSTWAR